MTFELPHLGREPRIPESCYVDPSARINGDVVLGEQCSVWFHACIRGDVNAIRIGSRTNIQDQCILHTQYRQHDLVVGDDVTYGHGSITHGCRIGNRVLIGMQAVVMDGAVVSDDTLIAAGTLVTEGKTFPPRVLLLGRPAKVARDLTDQEVAFIADRSRHYVGYLEAYARAGRFRTWSENAYRRAYGP
jgi:carbonic anhydrase/acetyltransferase-like protein (isoleucine patch superfamily)